MAITYDDALRFADEAVRARGHDPRSTAHAVQVLYLVGQLDFEITTGGVIQWLTNRSGRYPAETVGALEEIGASRCAAIVKDILALFPGGRPSENDVDRTSQVQRLLPSAEPTWRALGDSLLDWPDDVDALLREFVDHHCSEFMATP
jgi:hypothetical protein